MEHQGPIRILKRLGLPKQLRNSPVLVASSEPFSVWIFRDAKRLHQLGVKASRYELSGTAMFHLVIEGLGARGICGTDIMEIAPP